MTFTDTGPKCTSGSVQVDRSKQEAHIEGGGPIIEALGAHFGEVAVCSHQNLGSHWRLVMLKVQGHAFLIFLIVPQLHRTPTKARGLAKSESAHSVLLAENQHGMQVLTEGMCDPIINTLCSAVW